MFDNPPNDGCCWTSIGSNLLTNLAVIEFFFKGKLSLSNTISSLLIFLKDSKVLSEPSIHKIFLLDSSKPMTQPKALIPLPITILS